ncbi:MAG: DUF349 domain-containing protein [Dysgonamonadaceae bacterium]|jgi:hypothetical protein|nr:DUF349 domain-containing protein [Dysgonamonadaceae bacterium]
MTKLSESENIINENVTEENKVPAEIEIPAVETTDVKAGEAIDEVTDVAENEAVAEEIPAAPEIEAVKEAEEAPIETAEAETPAPEQEEPAPEEENDALAEDETPPSDGEVAPAPQTKPREAITDEIRARNLDIKKNILAKLKELSQSNDNFYKIYSEFRKLQQQWKEAKHVPQDAANSLWKEYQAYSDKFYELLKINNEMRNYDFKKNLELKQALCEAVERLDNEKDVISAFYQMQKLHTEWREIGPVARSVSEEIWTRFKKASSVINKKYQKHFEAMRVLEHSNLEAKTALCEEVEAIDYSKLNTYKDWDEQNKKVLAAQDKWKTVGFAPKRHNTKIFERFRAACDIFFKKKSEFYRGLKGSMESNLEKKRSLCEQAEALKDSQEWKEITDKFIELQKEWKTIGPVPKKHSNTVWNRFKAACDYFFEQKAANSSANKSEEVENLKKKREVIEKINAITEETPETEAVATLKGLIAEWSRIGFVPIRDKEKLNKDFHAALDKHFDRLKIDKSERRLQSFKSELGGIAAAGDKAKNKLLNERDKLMRTYERLKSDIQTYENNIGFLSVASKGGGGVVKDLNRKIESLKDELNLIVKKVEAIDENFEN